MLSENPIVYHYILFSLWTSKMNDFIFHVLLLQMLK
jgi:hypothetical protein